MRLVLDPKEVAGPVEDVDFGDLVAVDILVLERAALDGAEELERVLEAFLDDVRR